MKRLILLAIFIVSLFAFLAGFEEGRASRVVFAVPDIRGALPEQRGVVRKPTKFCPSAVQISGARFKSYCVEV